MSKIRLLVLIGFTALLASLFSREIYQAYSGLVMPFFQMILEHVFNLTAGK